MNGAKKDKEKKLIKSYGKISNHRYSGCSYGSACGPAIDIQLNIIERKKSRKRPRENPNK
ncbi:MAG: hypothetical protein ACETWM_12575 [Candidatus Lokiarchaeia archaeon]